MEKQFNELYKKYKLMVKGSFNKPYLSDEQKEDLEQDYWIKIFRNIDKIYGDQFEAYKMKINTKSILSDYIKQCNFDKYKAINNSTPLHTLITDDMSIIDVLVNENALDASKELINTNLPIIIESVLELIKTPKKGYKGYKLTKKNKVSEIDVQIIKEYYLNDKTMEEIGKEYNMSKENVRQRIEVTLNKFKKILQNNGINSCDDILS